MRLLVVGFCVLLAVGCSKSALKCNSDDIKELVISISTEELQNQVLTQLIMTELGASPQVYGNPTYKQWAGAMSKSDEAKRIAGLVDKQVADMALSLTNTRMSEKNDELKKCKCEGELVFADGKTHNIQYTAQLTDDNQLYAQVFGL